MKPIIMESPRFTVLNSKKPKKQPEILSKFPRPKIKYGPNTPISNFSPGSTVRSFFSQRLLRSHSPPAKTLPNFHPAAASPSFMDSLISRYERASINHTDIVSKFVKAEAVHVYWNKLKTTGCSPDARYCASLNIINRCVYIFGGEKADDSTDIKKLDYKTLSWTKIKPLNVSSSEVPLVKSGHVAVMYKNSLFIYGGFVRFDPVLKLRHCVSLIYMFDFLVLRWKSFKPTGHLPENRRKHCGAVIGNSLVIYAGLNDRGDVLSSLAVLNLDTMHWANPQVKGESPETRRGSTLTAVYHPAVSEYNNFDVYTVPKLQDIVFTKQTSGLYLFGGLSNSGKPMNDLFILKGQASKNRPGTFELVWTKVTAAGRDPIPRYDHCACLCTTFLVIFGGRNDSVTGGVLNDIAILRISSWRWEAVVLHNEGIGPRIGAACGVIGSRVIVFGGLSSSGFAAAALFELEVDQKKVVEVYGNKEMDKLDKYE